MWTGFRPDPPPRQLTTRPVQVELHSGGLLVAPELNRNRLLAAAVRCFFSKVLDATGTMPDAALHGLPEQLRSALTVGREIEPRVLMPDPQPRGNPA